MTSKWTLGLDYVYQNWIGGNKATEMTGVSGPDKSAYEVAYTNTSMVKWAWVYAELLRRAQVHETLGLPGGFPLRNLQTRPTTAIKSENTPLRWV